MVSSVVDGVVTLKHQSRLVLHKYHAQNHFEGLERVFVLVVNYHEILVQIKDVEITIPVLQSFPIPVFELLNHLFLRHELLEIHLDCLFMDQTENSFIIFLNLELLSVTLISIWYPQLVIKLLIGLLLSIDWCFHAVKGLNYVIEKTTVEVFRGHFFEKFYSLDR